MTRRRVRFVWLDGHEDECEVALAATVTRVVRDRTASVSDFLDLDYYGPGAHGVLFDAVWTAVPGEDELRIHYEERAP